MDELSFPDEATGIHFRLDRRNLQFKLSLIHPRNIPVSLGACRIARCNPDQLQ
ncbi:hypothetical protein STIAU_5019 [Stigmatella aurantiaca DW4/3-1]|uniref:Uncharacterized protein n=1 Tax=Stigmatella aurantiaca (strain DW4/3-1) TaxID=378806 RepID=Q096X0_STIAD|nr:hypothetical protein STIAU_5019 [Stigmatella aurantiaca DW4/3-1]